MADTTIRKTFVPTEVNFTPGERSFIPWISTERVDHEGDVVAASGIDFRSVYLGADGADSGNPVVMSCHNYGTWPIGTCDWIKVKKADGFAGIYGKATLDEDPDTERIWQKIKARIIRAVSIGFIPPQDLKPGEWGPPSPDELKKNPAWKGATRIIRRCVMIEFSVVPIPMNPDALIASIAKGVHRPQFTEPTVMPESEAEPLGTSPDAIAVYVDHRGYSGKAERDQPGSTFFTGEADIEGTRVFFHGTDGEKVRQSFAEVVDTVLAKAAAPDDDEDENEDDPEGDDDGDMPIHKGHFVKCVKGMHRGVVGKVKSIHRAGMVPDVEDDVHGTKDEPGLRIQCYKAMGDGHRETDVHIGCKMGHCEKTADLKPPKKKGVSDRCPSRPTETPLPFELTEADILTDEEVRARKTAELSQMFADPKILMAAAKAAHDQFLGVV